MNIKKQRILIVAAHPDDEIIGCGGSLIKHMKNEDEIFIIFFTDGISARKRISSTERQRRSYYFEYYKKHFPNVTILNFCLKDQRLDTYSLLELTQKLEETLNDFHPEIIYTHTFDDLNLDHQIVHRVVMTACRPYSYKNLKAILAFEVLSASKLKGNTQFNPNYYVDITHEIDEKVNILEEVYGQEIRKYPHPRSSEAIINFARQRGSECNRNFAECFELIRGIF